MSEETNHSDGDKPAVPPNPFGSGMVLTVILRYDIPMIHCGYSPAYRIVRVDLTPEQVAAIAPRKTGSTGRQEEYESISKAFIEQKNPDVSGSRTASQKGIES